MRVESGPDRSSPWLMGSACVAPSFISCCGPSSLVRLALALGHARIHCACRGAEKGREDTREDVDHLGRGASELAVVVV